VAAYQYFLIFPAQDFCDGFRDISSPPEPTLQFIILGGFSEEEERFGILQLEPVCPTECSTECYTLRCGSSHRRQKKKQRLYERVHRETTLV